MRIFSKVMAWVGLIILLAGIGLAAKVSFDIFGNMQPKNSVPAINPYPWIWAAVGSALLGGFLAGLGLGLASKYTALKAAAAAPAATTLPVAPAPAPAAEAPPVSTPPVD
ncbi:MAG: hypothetical protein AAGC63_09875 [Propionicimonas sp.]|nr:hypothetical protein [Propionicimonas sp.]